MLVIKQYNIFNKLFFYRSSEKTSQETKITLYNNQKNKIQIPIIEITKKITRYIPFFEICLIGYKKFLEKEFYRGLLGRNKNTIYNQFKTQNEKETLDYSKKKKDIMKNYSNIFINEKDQINAFLKNILKNKTNNAQQKTNTLQQIANYYNQKVQIKSKSCFLFHMAILYFYNHILNDNKTEFLKILLQMICLFVRGYKSTHANFLNNINNFNDIIKQKKIDDLKLVNIITSMVESKSKNLSIESLMARDKQDFPQFESFFNNFLGKKDKDNTTYFDFLSISNILYKITDGFSKFKIDLKNNELNTSLQKKKKEINNKLQTYKDFVEQKEQKKKKSQLNTIKNEIKTLSFKIQLIELIDQLKTVTKEKKMTNSISNQYNTLIETNINIFQKLDYKNTKQVKEMITQLQNLIQDAEKTLKDKDNVSNADNLNQNSNPNPKPKENNVNNLNQKSNSNPKPNSVAPNNPNQNSNPETSVNSNNNDDNEQGSNNNNSTNNPNQSSNSSPKSNAVDPNNSNQNSNPETNVNSNANDDNEQDPDNNNSINNPNDQNNTNQNPNVNNADNVGQNSNPETSDNSNANDDSGQDPDNNNSIIAAVSTIISMLIIGLIALKLNIFNTSVTKPYKRKRVFPQNKQIPQSIALMKKTKKSNKNKNQTKKNKKSKKSKNNQINSLEAIL